MSKSTPHQLSSKLLISILPQRSLRKIGEVVTLIFPSIARKLWSNVSHGSLRSLSLKHDAQEVTMRVRVPAKHFPEFFLLITTSLATRSQVLADSRMSQEYAALREENVRVPGAECQVSSVRPHAREISHGAIPKGPHKIALKEGEVVAGNLWLPRAQIC